MLVCLSFILSFVLFTNVTCQETAEDHMPTDMCRMWTMLQTLQGTVLNLQNQVLSLTNQVQILTGKEEDFVGFTASSQEISIILVENQPVIFNHTLINIGTAYNPNNGVFVCPSNGIYLFLVSLWTESRSYARVDLTKGTETIMRTVVRAESSTENEHSGNSVVVECRQGEQVWLRSPSAGSLYFFPDRYQTTFTGISLRFIP